MENAITRWMRKRKDERKEVTLDDVMPLHPGEYRGRHLRAKLANRREQLAEIDHRGHPTGMLEGPDGF
jgi:hypothetical protein